MHFAIDKWETSVSDGKIQEELRYKGTENTSVLTMNWAISRFPLLYSHLVVMLLW